jgi:hypothetical protein
MTLAQNLRQLLSGNKIFQFLGLLFLALYIVSCTPRARVIDSKPQETQPKSTDEEPKDKVEVEVSKSIHNIVLMLPFQLNRSTGNNPTNSDVSRSELALDFYQGFEIGLEKAAGLKSNFKVTVLDSRDNENEVMRLSTSSAVKDAQLIVGPVYPKEIKAFSNTGISEPSKVLRISPLAATMPSEFNLSNLVSITSPIITHVNALAQRLVKLYRKGDVILLYESDDAASRQFLPVLQSEIQLINKDILVYTVDSEEKLLERARLDGNNFVVIGSTNKYRLATLFTQLQQLQEMSGHRVQLFGHPNWAKMNFSNHAAVLESLQTEISSSYYVDPRLTAVRDFNEQYKEEFNIAPSEYAYKGYDTGYYFGLLLAKYAENYGKNLIEERFKGLHNDFEFEFHPQWGFVNVSIHFLKFNNGHFVRIN